MTIAYPVPMGIQGLCYVGAAGTTPTVVLGTDQKVELSIKNDIAKWATRAQPRKNSGYTTQELTMSITIVKDNTNASFLLIQAAVQGRLPIAIKSLDAVGQYGIDADWLVESSKEGQPIDGEDTIDYEFASNETKRALSFINSPGS